MVEKTNRWLLHVQLLFECFGGNPWEFPLVSEHCVSLFSLSHSTLAVWRLPDQRVRLTLSLQWEELGWVVEGWWWCGGMCCTEWGISTIKDSWKLWFCCQWCVTDQVERFNSCHAKPTATRHKCTFPVRSFSKLRVHGYTSQMWMFVCKYWILQILVWVHPPH